MIFSLAVAFLLACLETPMAAVPMVALLILWQPLDWFDEWRRSMGWRV